MLVMKVYFFFFSFIPFVLIGQVKTVRLTEAVVNNTVKNLKVVDFSPLYRDIDKPLLIVSETTRLNNNPLNVEYNLADSKPLSIMILGNTLTVFTSPGDDLNFKITNVDNYNKRFEFTGKSAPHYNYFQLLTDTLKKLKFNLKFDKNEGLATYLENLNNYNKFKNNFFSNYCTINQVSQKFKDFVRQEIDFEYISRIYNPFDGNLNEINLVVPENYFTMADNLSNSYLDKKIYYTSNVMLAYIKKYFKGFKENYQISFTKNLASIKKDFKNENLSFMLTNFIGVYAKEQKDSYQEPLLKLIVEAKKTVKDTILQNYIERREIEYTKLNKTLPEEILGTTFLKELGKNQYVSLKELLTKYKDKAVYIDFWASWCTPCREDIADSKKAKEYLTKKDVVILYFSLDTKKNETAWQNASKKDAITENQYIVNSDFKSSLAKYLNLNSIPRYIYLNQNHQLKSFEAPRLNSVQYNQLANLFAVKF
jgi:thiol-disulfide isomerase/thioredoxin